MDLNHLSTTAAAEDVDFDNLPEQMGAFADPPQPGPYRFGLPAGLSGANFEEYDSEGVKYLRVKFDSNAPLAIEQAINADDVGIPFQTRLTNQPRKRGKGDDAPKASDLDYLFKALGHTGKRPANNRAWALALIAFAAARKSFGSDIEFSWVCNPSKNIYADDGQGGVAEVPTQQGCGTKYYQQNVTKVDGKFPVRIPCQCGANIRAFANLQRFRA